MKKLWLILMSSLLIYAIATPAIVDARGGRSYRSPSGSFKKPVKPATPNVAKTQKPNPNTGAAAPAKRGFFSGGGLMRGLLIGGIAGLLFGGLFGNMGALGNLFGFIINILAIYLVFVIIRRIVVYFIKRRKSTENRY